VQWINSGHRGGMSRKYDNGDYDAHKSDFMPMQQ
jgi:hypothetical protein